MSPPDPLDERLRAHELAIWIGAEPTFTRRGSSDPWWWWQADPDHPGAADKRLRAAAIATLLAQRQGGSAHRVIGRRYPEEPTPRFCFGVRAPRAAFARAPSEPRLEPAAVEALLRAAPGPRPEHGPDDAWLTVTADPGVVEVNTAPCPDLAAFAAHLDDIWRAAAAAGLASHRWRYNGDPVDSGGGGQLTLGGPDAERSPFFRHPALLPRLVRYLNDHPALSYWFLGECAGSASQAPRADEGVRERWEDLRLACRWLEREAARGRVTPEILWTALAPLLVDASGNAHRAEINIEKLWNPRLADRGRLGVVEFRAFRMPTTPAAMTAAAALMRAVAARCALAPYDRPMADWGPELHDRWALPQLLAADLDAVLEDLAAHDLPLDRHHAALRGFRGGAIAAIEVGAARVELARAVEYWPLVGDVASQEAASARWVDASSERIELAATAAFQVTVAGRTLAARAMPGDRSGHRYLLGLRRRQYTPASGILPAMPPDEPLDLVIRADAHARRVRWYAWRPDGGAYPHLPVDAAEADARRRERLVIEPAGPISTSPAIAPTWTVDVRAWEPSP